MSDTVEILGENTGITMIETKWLLDDSLSFNAKGLLVTLIAAEPGKTSLTALAEQHGVPAETVRSGLAELIDRGYLVSDGGPYGVRKHTLPTRPTSNASWPTPEPTTFVYYIRRADGDVKIGYSGNVRSRMSALRREHGPIDLLATEPGTRNTERSRHDQFRAFRRPVGEWFAPAPHLLRHVGELAEVNA